ncbi:MAG: insulinase family protein [Clostridia bacterium]|nr:insulinase family protein [Clostridia bacterium]
MRKLLSWCLTVCLMLGICASMAESTDAQGMPGIGDTIHSFTVTEIRDVPLIGATAILLEHDKTGAQVMYLKNGDTNRTFDLVFKTRPVDDTGLPHVFEHATLDGSEKYPSKALWFNVSMQTYNSYMNASTYSVMTSYPVASLSEEQLLKLAEFYTDSCLHPMVMEDESIYREEAWRYRMASEDEPLTIEGTVYSEMLGATTLERAANFNMYRTAFPGSVVGFDQGGVPEYIPDMTWETLKGYHQLYYHPSNSICYLYGDLENWEDFLDMLEEAYAPYERAEITFEDTGYTPITEPVEAAFAYPVESTSSTDNKSAITYVIVCPGLRETADEQVVNTLTDLLNESGSVFMQSLEKALPTGSFGAYIDTTAPDEAVVFSATNVNPGDAALFRDTVDAALRDVAEHGFDSGMVDGAMASLNLSIRLMSENSDLGVNIIPNFAYDTAISSDPFGYLKYVDSLGKMEDWNAQGLYQKAVKDWLLDKPTVALVTTYPEAGLKEQQDAALAEKLQQVKDSLTEEEKAAIILSSNASPEEEDTSEMVRQLQAVTVESLPEEVRTYDMTDETDAEGIRHLDVAAAVEDMGQVALFLDAQGLSQEDIHFFHLLCDVTGEMDTKAHTEEELDLLVSRYLYGAECRLSLMGKGDDYHPYLRMGWISSAEDLEPAYDLMREIVFETVFDDTQDLLEAVQAVMASLRSSITGSPYSVELYRALSAFSEKYAYYNYYNYLDYYAFLESVEQQIQDDPTPVVEGLKRVQEAFRSSTGAMTIFAGDSETARINREVADRFFATLGKNEVTRAAYDLPKASASEALVVDGNVQYNALVGSYSDLGMEEYDGGLDALTTLVQDMYLIPLLRDQYGVYSVLHGALLEDGVYIISYRDPNVQETFAVYDALAELVSGLEVDQETLNGYILSAYSAMAKPEGELSGAMAAAANVLSGDDPNETLRYMRELKAMTPERVQAAGEMYRLLAEKGIRMTAGGAGVIGQNADMYLTVLNPFGVEDNSGKELLDVTEDGTYDYAALRYVYESGMMAPLTDDTFGVDNTATAGELMAVVYMAAGGPAGAPEEARDFLAGYGLVAADMDLDTPLTEQFLVDLFAGAFGVQLEATEEEPMTRGDLAEVLYMLFGAQ